MSDGAGAGEGLARNFGPAPFRVALVAMALVYFSIRIADLARARGPALFTSPSPIVWRLLP